MVRALGRIHRTCGSRIVIVECDAAKLPRLYAKVIDHRWKPVGTLIEIFGSIKTPYAAVLCSKAGELTIGEKLFVK